LGEPRVNVLELNLDLDKLKRLRYRVFCLTLRIFAAWRLCVRLPLDTKQLTQRRKAAKNNRKVRCRLRILDTGVRVPA